MRAVQLYFTLLLMAVTSSVAAKPPGQNASPTQVIVITTQSQQVVDTVEALGTLRANESVELTSAVTDIITEVTFSDNQQVQKGDLLLKMDIAEELALLAEQQAYVDEAQRQVNRLASLVGSNAASVSLLDENKRNLETAKARMQAIQSRIQQRSITAPFTGVLGFKNVSPGALLQPGTMITTIDDISTMKLDFSVPSNIVATLKPGLAIQATADAYPQNVFKGTIASINSRIDPVTRSIQARAILENKEGLLKPGLLMKVALKKNPRQSILIPEEAIITNAQQHYVYRVQTSKEAEQLKTAEKRQVILGTRIFGQVEITKGLTAGEQIITQGTLKLKPGDTISIMQNNTTQ